MTPALTDIPYLIESLPIQEQKLTLDFISHMAQIYAPAAYANLMENREDEQLEQLAEQRLAHYTPETAVSLEEVDRIFGWNEEMLDAMDEVELE
jgi:hypothetical protein